MEFAAKKSELQEFGKKVVKIANREILLVRIKGEIYACENECPHQGAPLSASIVNREASISCPRHGYRFSLIDGSCTEHPELKLQIYRLNVEGDDIFIKTD